MRLDIAGVNICIVNCHLAAHLHNVMQRLEVNTQTTVVVADKGYICHSCNLKKCMITDSPFANDLGHNFTRCTMCMYKCQIHGLHVQMPQDTTHNIDPPFNHSTQNFHLFILFYLFILSLTQNIDLPMVPSIIPTQNIDLPMVPTVIPHTEY